MISFFVLIYIFQEQELVPTPETITVIIKQEVEDIPEPPEKKPTL